MSNDNGATGLEIAVLYEHPDRLEAFQQAVSAARPQWHIYVARDLSQILECVKVQSPDCIVLEAMREPGATQSHVALRQDPNCAPIPILLATDFESRALLRKQVGQTGLSDIMVVADEPEEMIAVITVMGRAKHAEDKLRAVNRRLAEVVEERSRAFHKSEERFRFLFNRCSDALVVFEVDKYGGNGHLLDMNEVACKWTGYSRDEMSGISLRQISAPDRLNNVPGRLESILQHKELFFETVIRARDGSTIPVEAVTHSCELDESRNEVIALGRRLDTAEAHRRGDEGEQDYRFLAMKTGQLIYDCNLKTERVIWGGAVMQITGFMPRQILRMGWVGWIKQIHPDDKARVQARLSEAMSTMGKYQIEYRIVHKTGEYRHIEDHGVVLPDSSGRAYRLLGTMKDITARVMAEEQRRRLEQELQHSQRLESLGVLAGGIAHDFNNILAGIIGLTDLALREAPVDSLIHGDLTEALQAAHRAKELVKQILAFSRQSGQERHPIYLHIIAREVIKLLRASLPPTIEIIDSADINSGAVLANGAQMYQIITNFSTNAAQAMAGQQGKLEISIRDVDVSEAMSRNNPTLKPGPYVMLSVFDTGHGMSQAVMERVFDPFFTTKGPGHGTGMGLAVVHGIIIDHGGAVAVESILGTGATFYAYLPRIAGVVVEEADRSEQLLRGHERILFVDDDEAVLHFAKAALPRLGFSITVCRDGEDALKTFQHQPDKFDLVITDQVMPKMSGEDLAARIHAQYPDLPIILFTGFSEEISPERLEKNGILEVVLKPIIIKDLVEGIRRVLDQKQPSTEDN